MAIYFAEEFDKHVMPDDGRFELGVEFDLSARFATGRNMFGSGMRPPVRWRPSSSFHVPTTLSFRVRNLAAIPRSVLQFVLSQIARTKVRWGA